MGISRVDKIDCLAATPGYGSRMQELGTDYTRRGSEAAARAGEFIERQAIN